MIPQSKGLIYSYKDFNQKDLEVDMNIVRSTYDDICQLDTINYGDLTTGEQMHFNGNNYIKYKNDVKSEGKYRNKYFFKEFAIRYKDDDDLDIEKINRYSLSSWNAKSKHKGIDDRTLSIDLLKYNTVKNKMSRYDLYIVKTEHIYQLIKDLEDYLGYIAFDLIRDNNLRNCKVSRNNINLFVLPIYIYDQNKFRRISDIFYNEYTYDDLHDAVGDLYLALKYFVSANYYMLEMYNNNDRVTVYNCKTRRFSNMTFKAYTSVATNNKKVYSYTDRNMPDKYSPSVEISINTDRYNIFAGTDIPRKLCDYRFTVRGHKSHRWVGKRGHQHLEEIWIDPYEKNKDKPFRIIKETKLS